MGKEDAYLSIINGFLNGLNSGLDKRRERKLEDQKLAMQQEELTLRHEERKNTTEFNQMYKASLLGQGEKKINIQEGDLAAKKTKEAGDVTAEAEKTQLDAFKRIADLNKAKNELIEEKSMYENMVKKNPAKWQSQLDTVNTQIADYDSQIAEVRSVADGASKRVEKPGAQQKKATYLDTAKAAIQNAPDLPTAEAALAKALKGVKRGTAEYGAIMDEFLRKEQMLNSPAEVPSGVTGTR